MTEEKDNKNEVVEKKDKLEQEVRSGKDELKRFLQRAYGVVMTMPDGALKDAISKDVEHALHSLHLGKAAPPVVQHVERRIIGTGNITMEMIDNLKPATSETQQAMKQESRANLPYQHTGQNIHNAEVAMSQQMQQGQTVPTIEEIGLGHGDVFSPYAKQNAGVGMAGMMGADGQGQRQGQGGIVPVNQPPVENANTIGSNQPGASVNPYPGEQQPQQPQQPQIKVQTSRVNQHGGIVTGS